MDDCPCMGEQGRRWHMARNLACEHLRQLRAREEHIYVRRNRIDSIVEAKTNSIIWRPGTSIYLNEEDAL